MCKFLCIDKEFGFKVCDITGNFCKSNSNKCSKYVEFKK